MPPGRIARLETITVTVPEHALEAFEAALGSVCDTVGFFRDEATGEWRIEGVRKAHAREAELRSALALASGLTGFEPQVGRSDTKAEGWLARSYAGFPEQRIGRRFVVRGTHLEPSHSRGRIVLKLDAGLAFGSGEHGSTRGCLIALESIARTRRWRVLDIGTGSGILAIAAAKLLHRPVLATDIDPWSIRTTRTNAALNQVASLVHPVLADGWQDPGVRALGPYDLVFANILARPLCGMAKDLALNLAPNGAAVLSGILTGQVRQVIAAHRRCGLRLMRRIDVWPWATLVLRRS